MWGKEREGNGGQKRSEGLGCGMSVGIREGCQAEEERKRGSGLECLLG